MFKKWKERRKIKKNALQFTDKINRLGDLFKSYGFDVIYRGRIFNRGDNFYLRLQGDNVLELITKLGKSLNSVEDFYKLRGDFKQVLKVWKQKKPEEVLINVNWKYEYDGYSLRAKLSELDADIRYMEQIIYKKGEIE